MIKKNSIKFPVIAMLFMSVSVSAYAKDKQSSEEAIESQFENSKKVCKQKKEDVRDICLVEAEGKRDVALAKLAENLEPTLEHRVDYRVALAEAKYKLSIKKCEKTNTEKTCTHRAQVLRDKETEDARAVR